MGDRRPSLSVFAAMVVPSIAGWPRAQVNLERQRQQMDLRAHVLGMPVYLVDLAFDRGLHRARTGPDDIHRAVSHEWQLTLRWWSQGAAAAAAEMAIAVNRNHPKPKCT